MKITKQYLTQVIKEEISAVMHEAEDEEYRGKVWDMYFEDAKVLGADTVEAGKYADRMMEKPAQPDAIESDVYDDDGIDF